MLYQLKGCGKCNGDLTLDGDEWHCFQCGTYYYPQRAVIEPSKEPTPVPQIIDREPDMGITRRRVRTDINGLIRASDPRESLTVGLT